MKGCPFLVVPSVWTGNAPDRSPARSPTTRSGVGRPDGFGLVAVLGEGEGVVPPRRELDVVLRREGDDAVEGVDHDGLVLAVARRGGDTGAGVAAPVVLEQVVDQDAGQVGRVPPAGAGGAAVERPTQVLRQLVSAPVGVEEDA